VTASAATPAPELLDASGNVMILASSELFDHGADLLTASGMLVHGNERRWRIFAERVEQLRHARQEAES
jgi:hypothetical protein